jgi:hypothetical protein
MDEHQRFTATLPDKMPSAEWLINDARERLGEGHTPDDLRQQWAGAWDGNTELLAPIPVLAAWLDMKEASIYMARTRKRSDGLPVWPAEDDTILGRKMWRFSTIAIHRSSAPGRGWNLRSEVRESA